MTGIYGEGKVSILKGLQGILYAFPRIMIIIIIPGVRRSPQDVLSAPPGRVQGADREVRETRHRGRRPRQHRGQRGDAQRHAGAPDGEAPRHPDQRQLPRARHLHRGDPRGLDHCAGRPDPGLRQAAQHQRHGREALQDIPGLGSYQGELILSYLIRARRANKLGTWQL